MWCWDIQQLLLKHPPENGAEEYSTIRHITTGSSINHNKFMVCSHNCYYDYNKITSPIIRTRITWVLNTTELTFKGYQAVIEVLLFPKYLHSSCRNHSWREEKKKSKKHHIYFTQR